MKATELMIGNLVRCRESSCQGHRVDFVNELDGEVGVDGEILDLDMVFPIPLTPEIIEKIGFEEDDYYLQYTLYLDNKRVKSRSIVIIPQDDDWNEINLIIHYQCAEINIQIQYFHELQHALKLCGIEKEINL